MSDLRRHRFFFDADCMPGTVELNDPVTVRIAHEIREHGRATAPTRRQGQVVGEVRPIKDVVTERQGNTAVIDEFAPDRESLRQSIRARLERRTQTTRRCRTRHQAGV